MTKWGNQCYYTPLLGKQLADLVQVGVAREVEGNVPANSPRHSVHQFSGERVKETDTCPQVVTVTTTVKQ